MARAFRSLALSAAAAAEEKKGEDLLILNVGAASPVTDFLLIVTALSRPHLETLEHEIAQALKAKGLSPVHRARPQSDHWRILDYGGLMVHLMTEEARRFYALEKLYERAKPVRREAVLHAPGVSGAGVPHPLKTGGGHARA